MTQPEFAAVGCGVGAALLAAPTHPGGSSRALGDPDCCRQGRGRGGCMQPMTPHVRRSGLCQNRSPHLNLTPSGRLSIKPGEQNRHQNVTGDRYHSWRRGKGVGACSQVFDIALAAPGDRARSVFSHGEVWGGVAARGMMLRWLGGAAATTSETTGVWGLPLEVAKAPPRRLAQEK